MNRQYTGRPVCALGLTSHPKFYKVVPTGAPPGQKDPEDVHIKKVRHLLDEWLACRFNQAGVVSVTPDEMKTLDYQLIMKEYATACSAVESFVHDGKVINKPIYSTNPIINGLQATGRCIRVCCCCRLSYAADAVVNFVLLSFVASAAFIGAAVGFAFWGGDVNNQDEVSTPLVDRLTSSNFFGWPTKEVHTCYMNATAISGATIVTTHVDLEGLLVAKNLYCGLILGLVFGFLDNFGLFYGMDNLDPVLYKFGSSVISGAMVFFQGPLPEVEDVQKRLIETHNAADKLMSGLGNTFSDILGVILGTAALVIAKSGLGVDPAFWPLDIVAMLLGCLLGAFLPAFANESSTIGGENYKSFVFWGAWSIILVIFCSIIFAGIPEENYKEDWSFYTSVELLGVATAVLLFMMIFFPCRSEIGKLRSKYVNGIKFL